MKKVYRTILVPILLLVFFPMYTNAQDELKLYNAYYLAKAISKAKATNDKETILKLLGGIYWYAGKDTVAWDINADKAIFKKYPKLEKKVEVMKFIILDQLDVYKVPIDTLERLAEKIPELKLIAEARVELEKIRRDTIAPPFSTEKYKETIGLVRSVIESINRNSDSLQAGKAINLSSQFKDSLQKLYEDSSSFTNEKVSYVINKFNASVAELDNCIQFIEIMYKSLTKETKYKIAERISKDAEYSREHFEGLSSNDLKSTVQQYAQDYQSENAPQTVETSSISFKMPSETEMINALAIYLASRVKQEAVLWFFDELRKDADKYNLLTIAFPETMRQLASTEIYEVPNLGSTWRYALSKDFTTMPRNVFTSNWFRDKLPQQYKAAPDYLAMGWDIARYIQEKFSYRDIIRQLYLDQQTRTTNTGSDTVIQAHDVIEMLYALTNELYVFDSVKNVTTSRLLTFEELKGMTAEEMEIVMSLLDLKYSGVVRKICRLDNIETDKFGRNDADKVSRWSGKVLLTLSQFDKINNEYQQQLQKRSLDPSFQFSYYNVWQLLSQVLNTLVPEFMPEGKQKDNLQTCLKRLNDMNEIYELITNKNYAGGVAKVVRLLDSLIYNDTAIVMLKKAVQRDSVNIKEYRQKVGKLMDSLLSRGKDIPFKEMSKELAKGIRKINNGKVTNQSIEGDVDLSANVVQAIFKDPQQWGITIKNGSDTALVTYNSAAGAILLGDDRKAVQVLQKMASFLNDVAMAQGEKQLAKVVNSYAMPPGSYKRKRNVWSSVDLNAFVGLYGGVEWIPNSTQYKNDGGSYKNTKGFVYGISAPVGLTYTRTWGKRLTASASDVKNPNAVKVGKYNARVRTRWTTSFSLSLIDIGAVVSYRLNKDFNGDTTIAPHAFKWAQLVSPGIHANIAIPNTPLVFSLGAQYTPQLRKVEDSGVSLSERQLNTIRFYGGLFFDIPLFNLHSRERVVNR